MPVAPNNPLRRVREVPRAWVAWLESLTLAVIVALIGVWLRPHDPFFVQAAFPWCALAPLMAGLRYGFAYGFGTALVLTLGLAAAWRWQFVPLDDYPAEFGVGLLAVGMLAGEFSDMWIRQVHRLTVVNRYRRTRLDEFARGYHVLKASHDTLERKVAGTTQNLREALMTMRRELTKGSPAADRDPVKALGDQILAIFSNYGRVQIAALFTTPDDAIHSEPVTTFGTIGPVRHDDPLLSEALSSRKLTALSGARLSEQSESELIAAIPLVDVHERVWAVVAVRRMLFVAFHWENLKLLAVLGGHIADILASGSRTFLGEDTSPSAFFEHVKRSIADLRRYDIPGTMGALVFSASRTADFLAQQIATQRRGLDQVLLMRSREGHSVLFVLLPLTDTLGLDGYIARVERSIRERFGTSMAEAGVQAHKQVLGRRDKAKPVLVRLCQLSDVDDAEIRHVAAS